MLWWDWRLGFIVLVALVLITMAVKGNVVEWQAVPDGPSTYAVVKNYGGDPHWTRRPNEPGTEPSELRICSQVPSEEAARQIADLLNRN